MDVTKNAFWCGSREPTGIISEGNSPADDEISPRGAINSSDVKV